jgi:hypothetical protein
VPFDPLGAGAPQEGVEGANEEPRYVPLDSITQIVL